MPGERSPPPANKRQRSEPDHGGGAAATGGCCCGICLTEEGKAVRGEIDCCGHYFCYVCILEWAKVETRCPICKRRFSSILRPPKPAVFSSHRLLHLPHRDQVSFLYGNAGGFDPYEHVRCTVCQGSDDDYLLLLCDLCDSASHTYCIGLGATVPEGDWFCNDCSVSRTEYDESQRESGGNDGEKDHVFGAYREFASIPSSNVDEQSSWANSDMVRTAAGQFVSVYEIVHESDCSAGPMDAASTPPTTPMNLSNGRTVMGDQATLGYYSKGSSNGFVGSGTENEARNLNRCHNVQKRIRSFRENWEALRSGSLSFSSSFTESTSGSGGTHGGIAISCSRGDEPHFLSHSTDQTSATPSDLKNKAKQTSSPCDVEKAWKMMDKAKSVYKVPGRVKGVQRVLKYPSTVRNTSEKFIGRDASHLLTTEMLVGTKSKSQYRHCFLGKQTEKNIFQRLGNQQTSQDDSPQCSQNIFSPGFVPFSSPLEVQNSTKGVSFCNNWPGLQKNQSPGHKLVLDDERHGSCSSMTWFRGGIGVSGLTNDREDHSSSFSAADFSEQGVSSFQRKITSKTKEEDNAKRAIQSLVKLNLKLLSRNKQLGVDAFKEIARQSTHTILAACGLQHSRTARLSFPRSVCSHSKQLQQQSKSTLMPNSCRECFFAFVKDVVDSVFSDNACKFV